MKLLKYVLKRLALLVPVMIGVTVLTFCISHMVPSNPAAVALGPHATDETIKALQKEWGLDRPVYVQYLIYIRNLCKGDLGTSLRTNRPVQKDLKDYFPATLELTIASLLFSLLVGLPLGVLSAVNKDRLIDHTSRFISLIGVSMPVFWLGLLMILAFYFYCGLLPGGGRLPPTATPPSFITGLYILDSLLTANWVTLKQSVLHIIMPMTCLGFAILGVISRMMRSSMLNVLNEDYMKTAYAKGLCPTIVIFTHAMKNAILPVITISGVLFGQLLAGAVLTETIFSWPGMGLYTINSIMHLDFQPIMGFTVLVAVLYVMINLFVDILYVFFDPRIRLD
ncbi:MAG: ABC transporter permease [Deltaproteobacteria bacterium]|nr:ABC transporter permease [Deltaproteobacteria bacterium]